jgi:cation diffusion facilitator CzcD-associated flavoprotein CzcO
MSFSDQSFPYGPFVPHWVPKQYIENYFAWHRTDTSLVLNTIVEDVSRIPIKEHHSEGQWNLTLRRFDPTRQLDIWWEEKFDAVILANGHYSVPFVCTFFLYLSILQINYFPCCVEEANNRVWKDTCCRRT